MFSKVMHKHQVGTPAAQAVRNRRALVSDLARKIAAERPAWNPLRIMSVACGSAAEMMDIFVTEKDVDAYEVSFFDQDLQALSEARKGIESIEARLGRKVKAEFINASVRTMRT